MLYDSLMPTNPQPEWIVEPGLTPYPAAVAVMETRAAAIRDDGAPERIWLVEHPPLYTGGTSATAADLVDASRFPVFESGRGGQYTYHGPGQRVVYVILDLAARGRDVRCFVDALEDWMIAALGTFRVNAFKAPGRVGVWTMTPDGEAKIGAIGVRIRRWVTFHGLAINVAPDLSHYAGIVPCGLPDYPVTSLIALGKAAEMDEMDAALWATLPTFLERLG